MWVLILMVMTASEKVAVYDQGIYKDIDNCLEVKHAMIDTDFRGHNNIQLTCVRWEIEKTNISGLRR